MKRPSSVAVKIKYAHVAKDGRTPVYNANLNTWQYDIAPSALQMEASIERLIQVDNAAFIANAKAVDAFSKADSAHSLATTVQGVANTAKNTADTAQSTANTAKNTADTAQSTANNAQQTANTKVTEEEAVSSVRSNLFECFDSEGHEMLAENFQLQEVENGFMMTFCARPIDKFGHFGSPRCLRIADSQTVLDLIDRVEAIEKKLGIS